MTISQRIQEHEERLLSSAGNKPLSYIYNIYIYLWYKYISNLFCSSFQVSFVELSPLKHSFFSKLTYWRSVRKEINDLGFTGTFDFFYLPPLAWNTSGSLMLLRRATPEVGDGKSGCMCGMYNMKMSRLAVHVQNGNPCPRTPCSPNRMDVHNRSNVGYAFINFLRPDDAEPSAKTTRVMQNEP